MSGPIHSQCFPPERSEEFQVLTIDPATGKEIETIYQGSDESKASKAFIHIVKQFERAREEEGASYEPATVKFIGSGETKEIKVA